LIRLHS